VALGLYVRVPAVRVVAVGVGRPPVRPVGDGAVGGDADDAAGRGAAVLRVRAVELVAGREPELPGGAEVEAGAVVAARAVDVHAGPERPRPLLRPDDDLAGVAAPAGQPAAVLLMREPGDPEPPGRGRAVVEVEVPVRREVRVERDVDEPPL